MTVPPTAHTKEIERKRKKKMKRHLEEKRQKILSGQGRDQDTNHRIAQELPKCNWLEIKIREYENGKHNKRDLLVENTVESDGVAGEEEEEIEELEVEEEEREREEEEDETFLVVDEEDYNRNTTSEIIRKHILPSTVEIKNVISKKMENEKQEKKEELKSLKVKNWIEEKEKKEKKEREKKILEEMETPCIAIMENNEGETIQIRVKIPGERESDSSTKLEKHREKKAVDIVNQYDYMLGNLLNKLESRPDNRGVEISVKKNLFYSDKEEEEEEEDGRDCEDGKEKEDGRDWKDGREENESADGRRKEGLKEEKKTDKMRVERQMMMKVRREETDRGDEGTLNHNDDIGQSETKKLKRCQEKTESPIDLKKKKSWKESKQEEKKEEEIRTDEIKRKKGEKEDLEEQRNKNIRKPSLIEDELCRKRNKLLQDIESLQSRKIQEMESLFQIQTMKEKLIGQLEKAKMEMAYMESFRQMPQSRLSTPSSAAATKAAGAAGERAAGAVGERAAGAVGERAAAAAGARAAAALSKPALPASKHVEQHTQVSVSGPSNTTEQRSPARSNLHCKVENIPKVGVSTSSQQQIPPSCHILPSSHVLPSSHIIPSSHVLQSKHPLIHPPVHNSIPPSCHAQSVHPSHGLPSKPGFYPHPAHLGLANGHHSVAQHDMERRAEFVPGYQINGAWQHKKELSMRYNGLIPGPQARDPRMHQFYPELPQHFSMKYMPVLDPAPTNVKTQHTSKDHNGLARNQKDQNGIYRDQNGHVQDYSAVVREHNTVVRDQNGIVTTNCPNRELQRPREPGLSNLREFRRNSFHQHPQYGPQLPPRSLHIHPNLTPHSTSLESREVPFHHPSPEQFRSLVNHADFMNMTKEQRIDHYNRMNNHLEGRLYRGIKEGNVQYPGIERGVRDDLNTQKPGQFQNHPYAHHLEVRSALSPSQSSEHNTTIHPHVSADRMFIESAEPRVPALGRLPTVSPPKLLSPSHLQPTSILRLTNPVKEGVGPSRPSTSSEKSNSGSPFKVETSNHRPSSARSGGTCEQAGEVGFRPGEKMGELYTMGKSVNPLEEMYQHEPINLGKENSKCENCGKEAHFMCSACKNSHYCSSQCQRDRWLNHCRECQPV